ncbi:hypothetical protein L1987_32099 [Smallanthus sonchifolius]|uniref:Uncharacterized protein n=1 Tax=Smallanthus sonchifolius TaxID=185202 RepID=A0ACB9I6Q8_9ASTR|nr:hypothetical protein L1987_32099 [Smallanthus sonchifolius]
MPGVKLESNHIFPSGDRFRSKNANLSRKEDDSDTQWEELGPISQMKTKKNDFEIVSDNDLSDSDSESSPTGLQTKPSVGKKKAHYCRYSIHGMLPSYDDADKQKPSKHYSFVADKPVDGSENLINGILGSLKKSGNGSPESKFEG